MVNVTDFDVQDYLTDPDSVIYFLDAALEANDAHLFASALGEVAKSQGMSKLAEQSGLPRESLYQILSAKGNPRLETLMRVLDGLGFTLSLRRTRDGESSETYDNVEIHKNLAYA
ncbi:putative addiction module antidote protein [Alloscardovia omnicolens]|uniref:addiction module antidote protein n=1 Tax=Alloscardovia omnicolens TaxID=419015 RepID=UPI00254DBF53|nr:addiction module antidote protein [Alloscardovia omnicolens]MDK8650015.1 putative addiction module antidote protein [Alloscardovia omnicolens]